MYIPSTNVCSDAHIIRALLDAHAFAVLVSSSATSPSSPHSLVATHLPVLYDAAANVLRAHVAKANSQWRELDGQQVLCVFSGPHAFISPAWYRAQRDHVPTWNYEAVHVYGTVRVVHDEAKLVGIVRELSARFDPGFNLDALNEGYVRKNISAIVGLEIDITAIQAKRKLGQNRTASELDGVIEALAATGHEMDAQVAAAMAQASHRPFPNALPPSSSLPSGNGWLLAAGIVGIVCFAAGFAARTRLSPLS